MPARFVVLMIFIPLIAVFAVMDAAAQAVPLAWEWAHPDAKIVAGIDVRGFRDSSFGQSAGQIWTGQPQQPGLDFSKIRIPGVELLNDIDRVLISSTGEMTPAPKETAGRPAVARPTGAPAFLLVLEGNFPAAHYQALLHGPKRTYRTMAVYKTSKSGDGAIAVVDERTLLVGDEKSVFGALDRRGRALSSTNGVFARAAELAAANDFWLIATSLGTTIPSSSAAGALGMASQMASQLDGLELGASLKDGLRLDFALTAKTDATAQMLVAMLTAQMQMAANNQATPQAAELLEKLQISSEGKRMTMHLALSKEELERQMREAQAARLAGAGTRVQPKAAVAAAEPVAKPVEPQGPRKIRIVGLAEGVREIPLAPAR